MASLEQDKRVLDIISQNPNGLREIEAAEKLGLEIQDLNAWRVTNKNPEGEKEIKARRGIFDKVAATRPFIQEQGVPSLDRFVLKNLLSDDQSVQQKYLEAKGFGTSIKNDQLFARGPGQAEFKAVDPEGLDPWDFADISVDALGAVVEAFATSAKVIGAAAGGPVGLAIGAAAGGVASGSFEATKQFIGKFIGAREEISGSAIGQAAVLGAAIPVAFAGGGAAIRSTRGLFKRAGIVARPGTEAVEEAARVIGAGIKPTPTQLVQGVGEQQALVEASSGFFGSSLRKQISRNKEATKEAAEFVVRERGGRDLFEAGVDVEKQIVDDVAAKLAPAEEIYNRLQAQFKDIPPNLDPVIEAIKDIKDKFKFTDDVISVISKFESKLPQVTSLDELKTWRSNLGRVLTKEDIGGVKEIYNAATEARSKTLLDAAETLNDDFFLQAQRDITKADGIWKKTIKEIDTAILDRKKSVIKGPKKEIQKFFKETEEIKRVNKILDTGDPVKISALKDSFPEAFDGLRTAKIEDIAVRAEVAGEISPKKLGKIIKGLPKQSKNLIFDEDALLKANAIETLLNSVSNTVVIVNPSGTAKMLEKLGIGVTKFPGMRALINGINDLSRASLLKLQTDVALQRDILKKISDAVQSKPAIGAGFFGAQQATDQLKRGT